MTPTIALPADVRFLLDTLQNGGYEAYIVGGCVRDSILGRIPQDWDITTSALPEQTKALFSHTFDTGIQHGTITVVHNHTNYEITTYRIDGAYDDARHPNAVSFTSRLEEDLLRRDFTMNAIAYHPQVGFRDPFGGRTDIARGCIRGVGDPATRFQEDALRMLRCVRFAAQLGFSVEEQTYRALQEHAALIEKISVERIYQELDKLWKAPYPQKLPLLLQSGLLPHIDQTLAQRISEQSPQLMTQLTAVPPRSALRWTLVLQTYTEAEAKALCKKLKFDNTTTRHILTLLRHLLQQPPQTPYMVRKLTGELGVETMQQLLCLQDALYGAETTLHTREILSLVLNAGDCLNLKMLAVDGKQLQQAGVPAGKAVGEMLALLLDDVLHTPAHNHTDYLLARAAQIQAIKKE